MVRIKISIKRILNIIKINKYDLQGIQSYFWCTLNIKIKLKKKIIVKQYVYIKIM